jgi:hypothetical protein
VTAVVMVVMAMVMMVMAVVVMAMMVVAVMAMTMMALVTVGAGERRIEQSEPERRSRGNGQKS